jgi:hypothetical protein
MARAKNIRRKPHPRPRQSASTANPFASAQNWLAKRANRFTKRDNGFAPGLNWFPHLMNQSVLSPNRFAHLDYRFCRAVNRFATADNEFAAAPKSSAAGVNQFAFLMNQFTSEDNWFTSEANYKMNLSGNRWFCQIWCGRYNKMLIINYLKFGPLAAARRFKQRTPLFRAKSGVERLVSDHLAGLAPSAPPFLPWPSKKAARAAMMALYSPLRLARLKAL